MHIMLSQDTHIILSQVQSMLLKHIQHHIGSGNPRLWRGTPVRPSAKPFLVKICLATINYTCVCSITCQKLSLLVYKCLNSIIRGLDSINYHVYFFTPSGFPSPVVSVDSSGSATTGQNFALECRISFPIEPSIQPTLTWSKVEGGISVLQETSNVTTPKTTLLTLSFSPLTLSNRGRYRCVAELNVSGIAVFHIEKNFNLTVSSECNYSFTISAIVF